MDDCNHDLAENAAAMAKDHFNLLHSSTLDVNDGSDHKGKEIEDEASIIAEDCEDEETQQQHRQIWIANAW